MSVVRVAGSHGGAPTSRPSWIFGGRNHGQLTVVVTSLERFSCVGFLRLLIHTGCYWSADFFSCNFGSIIGRCTGIVYGPATLPTVVTCTYITSLYSSMRYLLRYLPAVPAERVHHNSDSREEPCTIMPPVLQNDQILQNPEFAHPSPGKFFQTWRGVIRTF